MTRTQEAKLKQHREVQVKTAGLAHTLAAKWAAKYGDQPKVFHTVECLTNKTYYVVTRD